MLKLPKVLNCQAAAEMSCRRRDGSLSYYQRVTLAIHLLMCAGCRYMDKQFALLDRGAKLLASRNPSSKLSDDDRLSPEAREQLHRLIR
ncbi:MAG: hypothetical protein ACP5VQ_10895 [Phycisphaerae bacterium]